MRVEFVSSRPAHISINWVKRISNLVKRDETNRPVRLFVRQNFENASLHLSTTIGDYFRRYICRDRSIRFEYLVIIDSRCFVSSENFFRRVSSCFFERKSIARINFVHDIECFLRIVSLG